MTLLRRTLVTFAWILVLMLAACGYVLHGLNRLAEHEARQRRISEAVEHAHFLDAASLRAILLVEQYVNIPDRDKLEELQSLRTEAEAKRRSLRAVTALPRIRELLDLFDALQPLRQKVLDEMIAASEAQSSGMLLLRQQRDVMDHHSRSYLREIVEIENEEMARSVRESEAYAHELRRNTVIVFALIIILTVLTSTATVSGISRRVVPLLEMAPRVSKGDFAARVPVQGRDEIARLSGAFNRMAAELQALDKAKEEFVALASHQLRTPATAVKANIAMLLDGYFGALTGEQEEYLRDAYQANERQLEIIDEILSVARVETGRFAIQRSDVDLRALVEASVAEGRFHMTSRGQALEVTVPSDPVPVQADGPKLRMVLDNLLSNASKYTPESGRIRLSLEPQADDVWIKVQDSGVGISAEDQHRLFTKFSRIGNPLSVSAGGTGLGLYLAREIVQLHGGTITVESRENEGSLFLVRLPRR